MKKNSNEVSARQTMRTIGQAEIAYNAMFPAQGYACSLLSLGGDPKAGPPSPTAAQIVDPTFAATGHKSGYTFTIACGSKLTVGQQEVHPSYRVYAVPDSIGRTGDNGYCADEANVIHADPAGSANCTLTQ